MDVVQRISSVVAFCTKTLQDIKINPQSNRQGPMCKIPTSPPCLDRHFRRDRIPTDAASSSPRAPPPSPPRSSPPGSSGLPPPYPAHQRPPPEHRPPPAHRSNLTATIPSLASASGLRPRSDEGEHFLDRRLVVPHPEKAAPAHRAWGRSKGWSSLW